jgi:hypothetical protein
MILLIESGLYPSQLAAATNVRNQLFSWAECCSSLPLRNTFISANVGKLAEISISEICTVNGNTLLQWLGRTSV